MARDARDGTSEEREKHVIAAVDSIAARLKLYAGTMLLVGTLVGILTAATVQWVTKDVRAEVMRTRADLRDFVNGQRLKAYADSARFERVLDIVELAVVALVEPEGSTEQRSAVAELRRRRYVTPRQGDGR